ncbi:F-box protein At1g60400-like [Bidens hawaiensis]|uniref:F-box protein At1g60400-like n=1 Tax=Bidens hawaiensis TaxID=980011 RepID=UPI00404959D6
MSLEGDTDRLSSLPDDLIHKILALSNIKQVIEKSVLSPRWRYIWTSMPYLTFSTEDFTTLPKFSKFITKFLSGRDNHTNVNSMKLTFRGKASQTFVKKIMNYAISHNVQQLNVVCMPEKDMEVPLSLFSSQSLKHLSLTMQIRKGSRYRYNGYLASTWELPMLTTLELEYVTLRDDNYVSIFSKCANMKNLTLKNLRTTGLNDFNICHPRLSNLTLENNNLDMKVVNVVAPQLQNLTIKFFYAKFVVSAPALASLHYSGTHALRLSTKGFPSLEKADICVYFPNDPDAHKIFHLLQQLHNVHILTLNLEVVEILSSSVELVLPQSSPFVNLKRLSIYPFKQYWPEKAPHKVAMSSQLKSYLLDGSPKCAYTIVLREEIVAQKIMEGLAVILEKEKKDNNKITLEGEEAGNHKPKKVNYEDVKSCWEILCVQTKRRKETVDLIISKLQRVEEILARLPASYKAKIQPSFSETGIIMTKLTDSIKFKCDETLSRFQLATTLESSS